MMADDDRCWRHHTIVKVWHEGGAWCFDDDQGIGTTVVDDRWDVEPHVGERVSYYGRFRDDRYTLGHMIERLMIGERLVWDLPDWRTQR